MKNKINMDDIKYLIPDYITGKLNDEDRVRVENALSRSVELKNFYDEMRSVFTLADSVIFEEPSPQYWSNVLPRIHERIQKKEKVPLFLGFKNPLGTVLKVLVPVAAVIIIVVIYMITNVNKESQNIVHNPISVNKDTVSVGKNEQEPEEKKENFTENNRTILPGVQQSHKYHKKVVQETENKTDLEEDKLKERNVTQDNYDIASATSIEEIIYTNSSDDNGLDEEVESELDKLNNAEQDVFLKKLSNVKL